MCIVLKHDSFLLSILPKIDNCISNVVVGRYFRLIKTCNLYV